MPNPIKAVLKSAYNSERFHKWVVRAYSTIHPPPYRRPNMEFDYDVWNGISSFYTCSGRQIGENNTSPEIYKEDIPTEHKQCKFAGTRYGRQINVTALKEVMSVWDDVQQLTTMLRNHYLKFRGYDNPRFNLVQSYVFSKVGPAYSAYLARRRKNPIKNGSIDALGATFFTLGVGPFMVVRALMEKGDLLPLEPQPLSADILYDATDASGALVSAAGKGCAGSPRLIHDFIDVVMNGTYDKPLDSLEAKRAFDAIDNWTVFYSYVFATARLELLIKLYQALSAQTLLALKDQAETLSDTDRERLTQSLAACFVRAESPVDDRTLLKNYIQVILALLDELQYPQAGQSLFDAGIVAADGSAIGLDKLTGAQAGPTAARRMREAARLIHPCCVKELASTHQALNQYLDHTVSVEDLYRRCCGTSFAALLDSLEC